MMINIVSQMKALGDSNRFRISMMLLARPLCVCELLEVIMIAGGTMSNHLKILREAGIIDQRKDGKWVEYFVADEKSRELLEILKARIEDSGQIENDYSIISKINRTICSSKTKSSNLKAFPGLSQ
jgi:ArsR family transcriptional regulator